MEALCAVEMLAGCGRKESNVDNGWTVSVLGTTTARVGIYRG